jgi:phosphopantothenoylcysteine decarboxylase/phosphopantothenate--cysteine ligase
LRCLPVKKILLIITGGIAAYKSLELVRKLKEQHIKVIPVMTSAAENFVTPMSVSALAQEKVHNKLFDLTDEAEMGHIELSRSADLIVVAPATADFIAKTATGHANDLASTLILATDTNILMAPAMNVRMWENPITQKNIKILDESGIKFAGPNEGDMACGEFGFGRMAEADEILKEIETHFSNKKLKGRHFVVTSGPTREPIDPVRFIGNRSSGLQGVAIAEELIENGAEVTFVTGPVDLDPPFGSHVVRVETADEMYNAVHSSLPADAAFFVAAVADWKIKETVKQKLKKQTGYLPAFDLIENKDILASVSKLKKNRPKVVIGFAAETENILGNAKSKLKKKGCDFIVANDVSLGTQTMGGDKNTAIIVSQDDAETLPKMSKRALAKILVEKISQSFEELDA